MLIFGNENKVLSSQRRQQYTCVYSLSLKADHKEIQINPNRLDGFFKMKLLFTIRHPLEGL